MCLVSFGEPEKLLRAVAFDCVDDEVMQSAEICSCEVLKDIMVRMWQSKE